MAGGRGGVYLEARSWGFKHHEYLRRQHHKAFAIALTRPYPAFGFSPGHPSETSAIKRALSERADAIGSALEWIDNFQLSSCRVYAIGDEVVWNFRPPTVRSRSACLAHPEVRNYTARLEGRVSVHWRPGYVRRSDVHNFLITLDRQGRIVALETAGTTNPDLEPDAELMIRHVPFWPLFGEAGCLERKPFRIRVGAPEPAA